jgi:hypothetical protein
VPIKPKSEALVHQGFTAMRIRENAEKLKGGFTRGNKLSMARRGSEGKFGEEGKRKSRARNLNPL